MDDTRIDQKLRTVRDVSRPPEPAYERLLRRRDRKRRNARVASAVTAFVVAAGAVVGVALAFGMHGSDKQAPHVPATNPVNPELVAQPGQYYYWKTVRPMPGEDVIEEIWWGEDGSGRYQADSTNRNYGTPKSQTWGPGDFPGMFPLETDLSKLSTDPVALLEQLQERTASGGASPEPQVTVGPGLSPETSSLWRSIANLVGMGNATPSLRAAIFDVTRGLPGVEERSGKLDPVGRTAVTLSVQLGDYYCGGEDTMYFDPETHLLLASDGDLGCVPSLIVVAGGIVDSRSEVVSPGEGLIPEPSAELPEPSPSPSPQG
jgi:hypothetical protein